MFLKRKKEEKRSKKHFNSYQFDSKKRLFKHKRRVKNRTQKPFYTAQQQC